MRPLLALLRLFLKPTVDFLGLGICPPRRSHSCQSPFPEREDVHRESPSVPESLERKGKIGIVSVAG
jgi:hypothetical protein